MASGRFLRHNAARRMSFSRVASLRLRISLLRAQHGNVLNVPSNVKAAIVLGLERESALFLKDIKVTNVFRREFHVAANLAGEPEAPKVGGQLMVVSRGAI